MTIRKVRSVLIYEALRAQILQGELAAGERLITREIAQRFSVSDIPVREALWMLARDGLVDMSAYAGARVASLSRDEVLEVLFIRSHLEGLATGLAAERLDEDGLDALREILVEQQAIVDSDAPDPLAYSALNRRFHSVIFDYCGNSKLTKLIASIWEGHSNLQAVFRLQPHRIRQSLDEHRAIFDALAARDSELAARLASEHKKLQQGELLAAIDEAEEASGASAASTATPGASAAQA
jgi:DNA-binding GntR family transcriptional regulator